MNGIDSLFKGFELGDTTFANRIAMAPMTRSFSMQGVPGPDVAEYYAKRAKNGVGLIITEGAVVEHSASAADPNIPRFFGADALAAWKHIVDAVHQYNGKIIPQIWHVGAMRKEGDEPNPGAPPVGPSGLAAPGMKVGEELSEKEIEKLVEAFSDAALAAKELGFDGVEIHGAHGYLIDQFFWEGTNLRQDKYGGDLKSRGQFAVDIVKACRAAVGEKFPILFRFSQWKVQDFDARLVNSPEELEQFLSPLVDAGVDMFHVSTRRFWEPAFAESSKTLAGWTRQLSGLPTMAVGSIGLDKDFLAALVNGEGAERAGIERVIQLMDEGEADMFAVGRALLADPGWVQKVKEQNWSELQSFDVSALQSLS